MYCLRKCLTVPEGFVAPEDVCLLSQSNYYYFQSRIANLTHTTLWSTQFMIDYRLLLQILFVLGVHNVETDALSSPFCEKYLIQLTRQLTRKPFKIKVVHSWYQSGLNYFVSQLENLSSALYSTVINIPSFLTFRLCFGYESLSFSLPML